MTQAPPPQPMPGHYTLGSYIHSFVTAGVDRGMVAIDETWMPSEQGWPRIINGDTPPKAKQREEYPHISEAALLRSAPRAYPCVREAEGGGSAGFACGGGAERHRLLAIATMPLPTALGSALLVRLPRAPI